MEITREMFLAQRSPRRGRRNPELVEMPVWEWLVHAGISAYEANESFDGPLAREAGPGWSFDRFGCSKITLPDRRIVFVAGEHEDGYDPDFFIYNDVIVRHPDRRVEIFSYPMEEFPPTDFHSATLIDSKIWLIGNLGYDGMRRHQRTQVCVLDLDDFSIEMIESNGEQPGWIHGHRAELQPDRARILVTEGEVDGGEDHYDNLDDWVLDARTRTWTRLTRRAQQQWTVGRQDGEPLMLFDFDSALFEEDCPSFRATLEKKPELRDLRVEMDPRKRLQEAGCRVDLNVFRRLYDPEVEHEKVPIPEPSSEEREQEEEQGATGSRSEDEARLRIGEALVRYRPDVCWSIRVRIEGRLGTGPTRALLDDLIHKLEHLHDAPCEARLLIREDGAPG